MSKGNQAEKIVKGDKNSPFQKNTLQNLLNRAIKFRKSNYVDHKLDAFKRKFAPVNGVSGVVHATTSAYDNSATDNVADKVDANGFESPSKELFARHKLNPAWNEIHPVGSGLKDLGHLSSLNAVLQILTYTPAFANYLLDRSHSANCTIQDYCFVCAVEEHVRTALKGSPYALQPRVFVGKLKKLSNGSTKNAFDVWNYFMEQIQSFLLSEKRSKDKRVQETTALYQIFGGYLQSKLQCPACNKQENEYSSFLNLSLDLSQCSSVEKCLSNHFKRNITLTKECPSCQNEGELKGKSSIYRSPMSLVIHLDRFNKDKDQTKINKFIKFEDSIDIQRNVTESEKTINTKYELYGAIVHTGQTINDGRYLAYVKTSNGIWYCMDSENVKVVSLKKLLEEKPYILFYNTPTKIERKQKPAVNRQPITKPVEETVENEEESDDEEEEMVVDNQVESDKDDDMEEEREKLQKAMEESATKETVANKNAIIVDYKENMKSKREKLGALIEKEAAESNSGEAKGALLSKGPNNQFQNDVSTWDEDANQAAEKRDKVLKQMKAKRKKVDAYDLDYDRGKVKKVKTKKEDKFNKPNLFQAAAEMKNAKKHKKK